MLMEVFQFLQRILAESVPRISAETAITANSALSSAIDKVPLHRNGLLQAPALSVAIELHPVPPRGRQATGGHVHRPAIAVGHFVNEPGETAEGRGPL
jgi:hypothetical protein